jgi:hypothetical protein
MCVFIHVYMCVKEKPAKGEKEERIKGNACIG